MLILRKSILLLLVCSLSIFAQTKLPSFFSNNMVLQQNKNVAIWGMDYPDTSIIVSGSWGSEAKVKVGEDGKWKLKLQTPTAGGPYTVIVQGTQKITLANVMIGEVWLCSGQSNMQMTLTGYGNQPINGSNEAILNSKNDQIRLFNTKRIPSLEPLDDVVGEWYNADPSTVGRFSATAYFFAKKLNSILNIPIGLIHTSWGGSKIEAWMDEEIMTSEFEYLEIPTEMPKKGQNQKPTLLYNGMIHPFVGYNVAGTIWYQGESNHRNAEEYKKLFPAMIELWREKWEQPEMPFYFVQISPYSYNRREKDKDRDDVSAFLREAQLYTMQTVENTGMAVTMDIGNCTGIHPAEKKLVGDRLAYWALSKDYNIKGVAFSGPAYKEMKITDDGKIELTFDYVKYGFTSFGKGFNSFTIAGENKVFYPADVKINRDKTLNVWSDKVKNPVAVRYGFEDCPDGTLFNTEGLPASSFRTDDWNEIK